MKNLDLSASNIIGTIVGIILFAFALESTTRAERPKVKERVAYEVKFEQVASELGVKPKWLKAVMHFESNGDHYAENPYSQAVGSIQFMPKTLIQLGTSRDTLCEMSPIEQLDYVLKYYQQFDKETYKVNSAADLYLLTLYPALVRDPSRTNFAKKSQKRYKNNHIFDANGDGIIKRNEIVSVFTLKTKHI